MKPHQCGAKWLAPLDITESRINYSLARPWIQHIISDACWPGSKACRSFNGVRLLLIQRGDCTRSDNQSRVLLACSAVLLLIICLSGRSAWPKMYMQPVGSRKPRTLPMSIVLALCAQDTHQILRSMRNKGLSENEPRSHWLKCSRIACMYHLSTGHSVSQIG